ncbi:outer membrane beta-barrel protein [Parapedobacter sp. GCM10030251]|uniref:outer membrane beta-barrel protein n=1 Tax=Parapedobacter sp. GCM10030251 TaxID=3273419 RepID=UPI00360EF9B1
MKRAYLEGIYKLHWGFLKAMALRYLLDEVLAEKAVDQCFRKFFNERARLELPPNSGNASQEAVRAAIKRVALPIFLEYMRKKPLCSRPVHGKSKAAISEYHGLLALLSPLERAAFNLIAVDGLTHGGAASLLGISRTACKALHCAAKKKLLQPASGNRYLEPSLLKSLAAALVLLFVTLTTAAQAGRPSLFKLGTSVSFFSGHHGDQGGPRIGFSGGIAPTIPLSLRVYLRPEVAFSMKGGRIDYSTADVFSGNVRYRINYFEFPLVLGIHANRWLGVELGGYAALKTGGKFDFQGTFAYGYGTFDRDDLDSYDYGPVFGLVLHSRRLQFGIHYYYGLNAIAANDRSRTLLGNAANQTIQVSIQRKRLRRKR